MAITLFSPVWLTVPLSESLSMWCRFQSTGLIWDNILLRVYHCSFALVLVGSKTDIASFVFIDFENAVKTWKAGSS